MRRAHGETFGPYRLEGRLGGGGMGEVCRAYDTRSGRYVALKRLAVAMVDVDARARFRRECRLLAMVRHPHIVEVLDHGEIDGEPYLVTQLVNGTDLARRLAEGRLDLAYTVSILAQVAAALDAAHAAGIVHRDVKPANILLAGEAADRAFLVDFGIAKPLTTDATTLTRTGEIGTLDYMAPERLTGRDVDGRADVYALACVLFQCLTGKLPFPAEDPAGKLAAQLNDPPPAPSLFGRTTPPALDLVVATGMDKDPARRYPTAGQLMTAAASALARAPAKAPPVPAAPAIDPTAGPETGPIMRAILAVAARQATVRSDTLGVSPGYAGSERGQLRGPGAEPSAAPGRSPYPGLRSFGEQEAELFRGRERAVTEVLVRLSRLSLGDSPLLVTGASGTGKSSLLRAGVLPALASGASRWPQVMLTPGPNPFRTLAARLASYLRVDAGELANRLSARPEELGRLAERIAHGGGVEPVRLVLVVDQFEELFTAVGDPGQREPFAVGLAHAWPALVVVAVRSDFLDHCLRLAPLRHAVAHPYVLSPLGLGDLERAIAEPARLAGLELEQGLADRLITDAGVRGDTVDDPGVLPRLAHALRQTWERRSGQKLTLRGYQETGGVEQAVALTADGVYQRLAEPDRRRLRAAVLRMVTVVDGGGLARRRARRDEVPADLTDRLVEARLATADTDGVQLSHDALLTAWPRLRQWVEDDRQSLLLRQRLGEAAVTWQTNRRDAGELYRGARLAAALEWAEGRDDLTGAEQAFLGESRRLQRRTTRRLRVGLAALAGLLVLALVAAGLALVARNDARGKADIALSRQMAAESLAKIDTDPVRAKRRALFAWRTSPTREARSALLSTVVADYPATFESGVETPHAVDISRDGRFIAVGGSDGRLTVIDTRTRHRIGGDLSHDGHDAPVTGVAFSPGGRLLATVATDLKIWDASSGKLLRTLPGVGSVVAWRSDGSAVAAEGSPRPGSYAIGAYDPRTGARHGWLTKPVPKTADHPFRVAFGANDTRLAIGRPHGVVELWDPRTAQLISRINAHRKAASEGGTEPAYVTFSNDYLATGTSSDRNIRLWDPRTAQPRGEIVDPTFYAVNGQRSGPVVFAPDGGLLTPDALYRAVVRLDPTIPQSEVFTTYFRGPARSSLGRSAIFDLAVAANGDFAGVLLDGSVRRWPRNPHWHVTPTGRVTDVDFSEDGDLATTSWDGLRIWSATSGAETSRPMRAGGRPVASEYGRKGQLVVGWNDGTVSVSAAGTRTRRFGVPDRRLSEIAVSPDGGLVAAVLDDDVARRGKPQYEIRMWNLRTGSERGVLTTGTRRPANPEFSPDGSILRALVRPATTGDHGRSELVTWRASNLKEIGSRVHDSLGTLGAYALTPNGDTLITATDRYGRIQLRNPRTGEVRRAFGRHPAPLRTIAVAPDGRTIATATVEEPTIRLWNLKTGAQVGQLTGHQDAVNDLEFSPDGRLLASAGVDTDVGVWLVDPKDAAKQICAELTDAGRQGLEALGC